MTNQELKLECFRLSGRGFNPLFEDKLHEAKRLYEWVSCEDEDRVTKYIRHALKEGVDLSEDLKEKPGFLKEKWFTFSPVDLPKETTSTFESTISTGDCRIKISHKGSERIIEVESEGDEITLNVRGTGDNNSLESSPRVITFCRPGVESLDERQATIKDTEENIIYKLTFI